MAQTHLKMAQTHLKLKMAQTHLKLISKIQNGSKWLKLISKFWLLTQKFKMAQTHLKSFNGRQGGILQSISGVSGASGGWQLCAQKFLMICCSFNWLSGIRFYQECKKLKCWLLTYWDHICIISFGIIDCYKHEKNRPNIGAVSNVWLRRSGETYKTWYPIILRQTCSSLARQCKIGG